MVNNILNAAGIRQRGSRFTKPPGNVYAVWFDDLDTDGPDGMPPCIFIHSVSIELYEQKPDNAAVAALEAELTAAGLKWTKEDRFWIASEQVYQTVYEFTYTEKRRTLTNG